MKTFLLVTISVMALTGCSVLENLRSPNCYERVAVSKITLTEAYKSAYKLSESEVLSIDKAESTLTLLDQADSITDNASALCSVDEPSALNYLTTAGNILDDATEIMKGEPTDE